MRSFSGDKGMEMVSKIKPGFYECIFDDLTSNKTSLFMITDLSLQNNGEIQLNDKIENNLQSNANQLKLKIQGSIFSNCFSSLKLNKRRINGGLINIISKGTRIEIGGCDFSDNLMHSRNMVYIGFVGGNANSSILNICGTILTNCSSIIPGLDIELQQLNHSNEFIPVEQQISLNSFKQSNQLYADGKIIMDDLYKHGLINIEQLNKDLITSGIKEQIIIDGIFAGGCHSAVGSALTVIGMQLQLTDSIFVESLCFGNMIYLNQTKNNISGCQFVGYNGSFINFGQIIEEQLRITDQPQNEDKDLCTQNKDYFSSSIHALLYIKDSESLIKETSFENTGVGAIKVEDADIIIEDVQFTETNASEDGSGQFERNEIMVSCVGESNLKIVNPIVNGRSEQDCGFAVNEGKNKQQQIIINKDQQQCNFGIYTDPRCNLNLSSKWTVPKLPFPILTSAKLTVDVSDIRKPLQFEVLGSKFIPLWFNVLIYELRNKTDEEIYDEMKANKHFWKKYKDINSNYQENKRKEKQINQKKLKIQQNDFQYLTQQFTPFNNENESIQLNEKDLKRDKHGFIIWPPDNASTIPFTIMPKVYGSENAQFKMTDYSWLNSRKYIYGILASNDGVHFSGTDGIIDQEGVEIEVEVVDGEQFVNFARFKLAKWQAWLIPPVFVTTISLITFYIIFMIWKRYDGRKQRMAEIKRKHQLQLVKEEKYRQKIEEQQSQRQDEEPEGEDNNVADIIEESLKIPLPYQQFIHPDIMMTTHNKFRKLPQTSEQNEFGQQQDDQITFSSRSAYSEDIFKNLLNFTEINSNSSRQKNQFKISPQLTSSSITASSKQLQQPYILQQQQQSQSSLNFNSISQQQSSYSPQISYFHSSIDGLSTSKNNKHIENIENAHFTGFLANQEALPIDFSWLQPGCVELQGVNWGEQGPPETLGLASQGIISPTQEMINKQSEQESVFKPLGQNNEQLRLQMISPVGQMLLSTKMKSPIRNIGSNIQKSYSKQSLLLLSQAYQNGLNITSLNSPVKFNEIISPQMNATHQLMYSDSKDYLDIFSDREIDKDLSQENFQSNQNSENDGLDWYNI